MSNPTPDDGRLPPCDVAVISEAMARRLVGIADAIMVIERAFAALDTGLSRVFPFAAGHGPDPDTRFGVKAGYDGLSRYPGAKLGSYWADNRRHGLAAHGSTTLLLDDRTGRPKAVVAANYLTALRTAAANAVAVRHLARPSATRLSILGSGHQAYYEALAVAEVRPLDQLLIWSRDPAAAAALARRLADTGLPARDAGLDEAVAEAEILCTVTAAAGPLFDAAQLQPGTHVSAMGADGPGKQELPPALFASSALFADLVAQSLTIGEFQHIDRWRRLRPEAVTPLGAVINGSHPGRTSERQVTIFDSSGIAIQDIAIAALALERAHAEGIAEMVML